MATESTNDPLGLPEPAQLLEDLLGGGRRRSAAPYGIVWIRGPEAAAFLHRMCSQDVIGLAVGAAVPAAFLDAKGRLVALATVGRLAEDEFALETQVHQAGTVRELLDRYHFTERLEIPGLPPASDARLPVDWQVPDEGPGSGEVAADDTTITFQGVRHGVRWQRVHPRDPNGFDRDAVLAALPPGEPLSEDEAAAVRLLTFEPWIGTDTEERTLGMEAGIDDVLSTTKGCYTGQEIVARIHTYGKVNRKLCLLLVEGTLPQALDTEVVETEDRVPVGRIKTMAPLPGRDQQVAFAWLPGDFWAKGSLVFVDATPAQTLGFGPPAATST